MKRIHSTSVSLDALGHYDDGCEINKILYKHHYPLEHREALMRTALNGKLYLDDTRFKMIEDLLVNKKLGLQYKFYSFIDILTLDELAALGW